MASPISRGSMLNDYWAKWFRLPEADRDGLAYWRERILVGLLAGGVALCPVALVPSVVFAVRHHLWALVAIHLAAVATLVVLLFSGRLSYRTRSWGVVMLIYGVGTGVLIHAGFLSGGPVWLFIIPIIASLLLGPKAALGAVLINAGLLSLIGFVASRQGVGAGLPFFSSRESAFAALGNYLLLNAAATLAVALMIQGLDRVIRMQAQTADRLSHEVGERRRGADALRESEAKYRRIFENIQDVYYETSLEGRILLISPSISKIFHYTPEMLIGRSVAVLYADPARARKEDFLRWIRDRRKVEDFEVVLKDADGSVRTCALACAIVNDAQGKPLKIVGALRDVTARKAAEAERACLEAANIQLQKGESLGRMAGAVAHHFNNHLSVVMGNLELAMADSPGGSPQRQALEEAMLGARRAAGISRMMLTYLGQHCDARERLDLSDVCRRCQPLIQAALPGGIELELALAAPGPVALISFNQMQQILMNLMANALEAIGEAGGHIVVKTGVTAADALPGRYAVPVDWEASEPFLACLEISDDGQGIAPQDLDKLFDPFFTTKFVGRGLGLSVVLGIVKAWGGRIDVQSQIGRGSVFRIALPLVADGHLRP